MNWAVPSPTNALCGRSTYPRASAFLLQGPRSGVSHAIHTFHSLRRFQWGVRHGSRTLDICLRTAAKRGSIPGNRVIEQILFHLRVPLGRAKVSLE